MKFEQQPINNLEKQEKESEIEKTPDFKGFLAHQISLPSEKWSEEFTDYIEKKRNEEFKEENSEHISDSELTYKRYLKGLELDEGDLKNKRILDLGCGKEGEFVKECIDKDLTEEIYGLDLEVDPNIFDENLKEHFFKKDFKAKFPVKDLDYVVSVGALQSQFEESDKKNPAEVISQALETINDKGEIRIYPINKAPFKTDLEGMEYSRKKWDKILDDISSKENIEYEFKPIDIRASKHHEDIWLEEVLVIKKLEN